MKLCCRLFVLYCRNCPKDDKFRYSIPIFEEVRGGVEPWLVARWKARIELLLSVIGLLFLSLPVEALQCKMCQNSLPSGGGRSLGAKISGGRGRPCGTFFAFYKTRHILLSDSANYTVLRAVVLTQYRRVPDRRTDGQTDGIAVASTALAMRALRRAVKSIVRCGRKKSSRSLSHLLMSSCFPIVDTCLSCEDTGRQSCTMVPKWRFLRPVFPAIHMPHISDMHSKFALRPHHV